MAQIPCDKIKEFSTSSDTVIGMYGNKPIYRKYVDEEITHTASSDTKTYYVSSFPSSTSKILGMNLVIHDANSSTAQPIPYYYNDNNYMNAGTGMNNSVLKLIVQVHLTGSSITKKLSGYVDYIM